MKKKKFLSFTFKKLAVPLLSISIFTGGLFTIIEMTGITNFFKSSDPYEIVKNANITQATAIPGQPIKWTVTIDSNTIALGQHLVEIPKSAQDVKIRNIKQTDTQSLSSNTLLDTSDSIDRKVLSELARQNASSRASLNLHKLINKQAYEKSKQAIVKKDGDTFGLFARAKQFFAQAGSILTANAEDGVNAIEKAISENNPDLSKGVIVIDVSSQANFLQEEVPAENITPVVENTNKTPIDSGSLISDSEFNTEHETATSTSSNTASTTVIETGTNIPDNSSGSSQGSSSPSTASSSNPSAKTNTVSTTTPDALTVSEIVVEYETPAPIIAEAPTQKGKIVTVSDAVSAVEGQHTTNVLAFTNIPEIYKVGQEEKIKINWLNNDNQPMPFIAYDLDENGMLDYIEWTVPHLSTQTFEIIFISKALELDENKEIMGDIFDEVREQDGIWVTVSDRHAVRATFEKFLTNKNDVTLYARPTNPETSVTIKVYPVYDGIRGDTPVALFNPITREGMYRVLLTNLMQSTDVFDIQVTGSTDIDYIVDPTPVTITDSFTDSSKIASMLNVTLDTINGQVTLSAASSWSCGSPILDSRDAKVYNTVLIGSQCWMQQNLNVGTLVTGVTTQGTSCSTIQKYCYSDNEANCSTGGGLYQWNQTMCGSTTAGAQGICPAGWHIPTHDEFTILERTTCTSGSCATDFPFDYTTTGWRGTNEGTTLKNQAGLFRAVLSGYRSTDGSFSSLGSSANFWSSVASGGSAWSRHLGSGFTTVDRYTFGKAYGFSVRCLKD